MNNLETTREAAREFLDRMVQEGILVKVGQAERSEDARAVGVVHSHSFSTFLWTLLGFPQLGGWGIGMIVVSNCLE